MFNIIHSLQGTKKKFILAVLLLLGGVYIATELLVNSQNILYRNAFWYPYRATFFGMRGQGIESLLERSMIAGQKLRTNHQRVFSRKEIFPETIAFKMRYLPNSFVDIIFNGNNETYEAIRISSETWRGPHYFKTKHTGEYVQREDLRFYAPEYKTINVVLKNEYGDLYLYLNDEKHLVKGQFEKGKIGFDLSELSEIWDPVITTVDGRMIKAGFTVEENIPRYFFINLIIFSCVIVSIVFISKNRRPERFLRLTFFFFLISGFLFIFDFYYYSQKLFRFSAYDFSFRVPHESYTIDPETVRHKFFRSWFRFIGGKTPDARQIKSEKLWPMKFFRARFCDDQQNCKTYYGEETPKLPPKSENSLRILIWGGSLSAGSCLVSLTESYPEVIQSNLIAHLGKTRKIELLNSSRGDTRFDYHFPHIMNDIEIFKPDIIYLDSIPPMENPGILGPMYKEIAQKVPIVIFQRLPIRYEQYTDIPLKKVQSMLTGNLHPEHAGYFFFRNDFLVQQWVKEFGLIFVDPNTRLLSDEIMNSGQLFWDSTHLTPHGHKIWGDFLTQHLLQLLEKKKQ